MFKLFKYRILKDMSSPMPATINVENGSPTVKQRVRRIFNFPYLVTFLFIIKVALIVSLNPTLKITIINNSLLNAVIILS